MICTMPNCDCPVAPGGHKCPIPPRLCKGLRPAAQFFTVVDASAHALAPFRFATSSLRARGVGRVADEPRALLVLLTDIPGDDDIRALHEWLVHRTAWLDADIKEKRRMGETREASS